MQLALTGTGRTGTAVARLAQVRGHVLVAQFNSGTPLPDSREALAGAEAVIDFSQPDLALTHLERYCRWRIPAVIGTTGWYAALPQVAGWVRDYQSSVLYAPNFSLGVALLVQALRGVLPLLDQVAEYDAFVHEYHHAQKRDSPSGTALMLGQEIVQGLARKTHLTTETQHGPIPPDALHVTSTRAGHIFGQHYVGFDSPFDHLAFIHESRSRDGFAFGALRAAEWLPGRTGLFTLDDLLADWLGGGG
jgi:4-hydroxy-tetrahydrodipicolinate reductase